MRFRPYIAGDGSPRLPQRGDIAVIGIDSGLLDQWIITWHRDDHSNPPYAAGGGGGDTTSLEGNWNWTTSTTTASTRAIGINTAAWNTATQVNISETTSLDNDVSTLLSAIRTGDQIYIQDAVDSTKWARYQVNGAITDQGTWRSIPVMHVVSGAGGTPSNNRDVLAIFVFGTSGGGGAPSSYVHTQGTPATTWNVVHNLGFFPNVAAVDSLNREFIADVTYVDVNNLTITLTAATAGKAYVS